MTEASAPSRARRSAWIAEQVAIRDAAKGDGKFHVRGLHYSIVSRGANKPNGVSCSALKVEVLGEKFV